MKPFIVIVSRCLNEENLMPVFLANYSWASTIVIADGGSTDNSKKIAKQIRPDIFWYEYDVKVPGKNGGWRNPEGAHVKFTLDHAEAFYPDWIWFTEIDAIPNLNLQRDIEKIFTDADENNKDSIQSWLCYIAPDSKEHYPDTMLGVGNTAWRSGKWEVTNLDDPFEGQGALQVNSVDPLNLGKEYSRIHLTFETEELIEKKNKFYQEVHGWSLKHPNLRCGPREILPEWASFFDPRNKCCGFGGYEHIKCLEK